jgi:hypothetical protein
MLGPWKNPPNRGPGFVRFHPFDLEPGQSVVLRLWGVYANCGAFPKAGFVRVDDFPVRYSFLWRTSTATIPLPDKLTIIGSCGRT